MLLSAAWCIISSILIEDYKLVELVRSDQLSIHSKVLLQWFVCCLFYLERMSRRSLTFLVYGRRLGLYKVYFEELRFLRTYWDQYFLREEALCASVSVPIIQMDQCVLPWGLMSLVQTLLLAIFDLHKYTCKVETPFRNCWEK